MIPVPEDSVYLLDTKNKSYGYKRLLSEQYSYINMPKNKKTILDKAERIYTITTNQNTKSKTTIFYKKLSCNFKLLEEKCNEYVDIASNSNALCYRQKVHNFKKNVKKQHIM